jgi:hypothetical protein
VLLTTPDAVGLVSHGFDVEGLAARALDRTLSHGYTPSPNWMAKETSITYWSVLCTPLTV